MGKNHFSFLLVLIGLVFTNQNVFAGTCNKTIDELKYAGTSFPTKYTAGGKPCVEVMVGGFVGSQISANKEMQALAAQAYVECKGWSTKVINYANAEFGGGGGYYHQWACSTHSAESIKLDICENIAASESRFNGMTNGAKITFKFKENKCMCSVAGIDGERDCSKTFPFREEVAKLKTQKEEEDRNKEKEKSRADSRKMCEGLDAYLANDMLSTSDGSVDCICKKTSKMIKIGNGPKPTCVEKQTPSTAASGDDTKTCESFGLLTPPAGKPVGAGCFCKGITADHSVTKDESGLESCKDVAKMIEEERQRVAAAAAAPTEPTQDLKTCVDEGVKEAQACKESQESAGKICDEKNLDKDAEKIKNAATGAYISTKSGTGAQQECFTASLASNVGLKAIKMVKDDCESLVTSCKTKCSTAVFEKFEKECKPKVAGIAVNEQYYNSKANTIKTGLSESLATCEGKVEKDKGVISDLFNQVGDALGKSVQCMCQLSSGATTSAKEGCNIPSPQTCDTNPSLPGCKAYTGLGPCTPGSGYDAKLCSCQLEPKGAGCPGGSASGNLVGFASGANINSAGGNDPSFGSPVGDLKGSSAADLGGLGSQDGPAANLSLESTKVGSAGNPGGGAVGGGSSSGAGGAPDAPTGEGGNEQSGLSGLFNQAKTFMSNLAGGDKSKQNGALNNNKNKKPDVNQFRPRGMASSESGVGTKNMDIWKMMNMCTNGENCKSNVNNYILGP